MTLDEIFIYWQEKGWRIVEFEWRSFTNRPDLYSIDVCADTDWQNCYNAHGVTWEAAHLSLVEKIRSPKEDE